MKVSKEVMEDFKKMLQNTKFKTAFKFVKAELEANQIDIELIDMPVLIEEPDTKPKTKAWFTGDGIYSVQFLDEKWDGNKVKYTIRESSQGKTFITSFNLDHEISKSIWEKLNNAYPDEGDITDWIKHKCIVDIYIKKSQKFYNVYATKKGENE